MWLVWVAKDAPASAGLVRIVIETIIRTIF
jgi:hypothetical protein